MLFLFNLDDEGYAWPPESELDKLDRPNDFNEFRQFAEASKDYIGLIYADANNMGKMIEKLKTLSDREVFAKGVDGAVHKAIAHAINKFLPIVTIEREEKLKREKEKLPVFPFDLLLVGGDDIVMVTDATKAVDVACALSQQFRVLANDPQTFAKYTNNKQHIERIRDLLQEDMMSLSVGVVLAPVKYPFGLLQDMAESALKFAKKSAHDDRTKLKSEEERKQFDGSRINFFVVAGGSKPDFKDIYKDLYYKRTGEDTSLEFHATLRPYTPEELQTLLDAIREGKNLGRTKLHQLREAVYDKNLSKSVMKALAALRSWNDYQRDYIIRRVVYGQSHEFRKRYKTPDSSDPQSLVANFPRVTFPWFYDGENKVGNKKYEVYRTPLLDFIELYDFVAREGGKQ